MSQQHEKFLYTTIQSRVMLSGVRQGLKRRLQQLSAFSHLKLWHLLIARVVVLFQYAPPCSGLIAVKVTRETQ